MSSPLRHAIRRDCEMPAGLEEGALEGLFHAGHWTRPGGGVAAVSYSGVLAEIGRAHV